MFVGSSCVIDKKEGIKIDRILTLAIVIVILFRSCAVVCFFAILALITVWGAYGSALKKIQQEKQQLQQQKEKELAKSRAKFQVTVFHCTGKCSNCKMCHSSNAKQKYEDTVASSTSQPGRNAPVGPIPVSEPEIIAPELEIEVVPPASVSQKPQKVPLNCSSSIQRRKQKRKLHKLKTKLKDRHVFTASEIKCLSNKSAVPVLTVKKELKCFVKNTAKISDSPVPHNRN